MDKNKSQISENKNLPSFNVVEDLLKCKICFQSIANSKMLPCQHTYCSKCLENLIEREKNDFVCPTCRTKFPPSSLKQLPKNVYVESLIELFSDSTNPQTICMNCGDVDNCKAFCDHCKQNFCELCWEEHLTTLKENFSTLMDHIDESENQLEQQNFNFQNACEEIVANIKAAVADQISRLELKERQSLDSLEKIKERQDSTRQTLMVKIYNVKRDLGDVSLQTQNAQLFMHFHNKIVDIVNDISKNENFLPIFDQTTFKVEQLEHTELSGSEPLPNSIKTLSTFYSHKIFCPKLIWSKCPRPAGLGIPPWNENIFYIATTDKKLLLIMNRKNLKVVATLSSPEMFYPHSLTFCGDRAEVYVSDKWKSCIHVFSSQGKYLRSLCSSPDQVKLRSPTAIALYRNQLMICDAGSDAVVIINPVDGKLISVFGFVGNKTQFQTPTGIAVFQDRIIVGDSGNHRVKIFKRNGDKLFEFGSMGKNRGQFKSMDVVACDSMGFIFIGDAVNRRVQVFRPDGKLVRIFNTGKNAISGLLVTPQFEIIVTDTKARLLQIF